MADFKILHAEVNGIYALKFIGEVRLTASTSLDRLIQTMTENPDYQAVVIDLTETTIIDSTTLGMLAKIAVFASRKNGILPTIISTNNDVTRILGTMGFGDIFFILSQPASDIQELEELPVFQSSEKETHKVVLEAHKVLMNLNTGNKEKFKHLVAALESDGLE